jgi:exopolyphosphatase/guanosine-5'-triphosphate,3'-diphosphate pyrophosphatase
MTSDGPVAAIDCGTNSTRLLVAGPDGQPLERLMRITRLGQGVDATGTLADQAIDRCLATLAEFRKVMDHLGVVRARLVATSAARDAANGQAFLTAAAEVSGIQPELLAGVDEGRLSMAGAVSDLGAVSEPGAGPYLVLDIGGGSTELVAGNGPDDPDLAVVSLQLGCVRVSERYLTSDPPTPEELDEARAMVADQIDVAVAGHPGLTGGRLLVGLAGTVTTLSSLQQGHREYRRDEIHHSWLTAAQVDDWYRRLSTEDHRTRLARPGMVAGREDVMVGGAMILRTVMHRFGFDRCLVSEADILDGMVAELLS